MPVLEIYSRLRSSCWALSLEMFAKPRLVADFSPCNSQLPVSTTSGIAVGDVLLALRCLSPGYIIGYDCASAFYRIRLSPNRLLYMHSGMTESNDPDYVSTRLSFGLGAGPPAMEESLGWLVACFRASPYAVFLLLAGRESRPFSSMMAFSLVLTLRFCWLRSTCSSCLISVDSPVLCRSSTSLPLISLKQLSLFFHLKKRCFF